METEFDRSGAVGRAARQLSQAVSFLPVLERLYLIGASHSQHETQGRINAELLGYASVQTIEPPMPAETDLN